jgi:hypothetical protein
MSLIQPEQEHNILSLLQQGLTQCEIARKLNTYQVEIHRRIKKLGIDISKCRHCICGKKITIHQNNKYCSRDCYNEDRKSKYKKYYYCAKCKWIPHNKAVFKPKGSILRYNITTTYSTKKDGYYCPKCNLNLRIKKRG